MYAKSQETKERILNVAFNEIHLHGYQAASLSKITSSLGMTKGVLYYHFSSKKDLGLAVVNVTIHSILDRLWLAPLRSHEDPREALSFILNTYKEMFRKSDDPIFGCPINNLNQEMSPLDDDFREALEKLNEEWRLGIARALKRGVKLGYLKEDLDVTNTSYFIMASFFGIMSISKSQQSKPLLIRLLGQLEDYVLNI